MTLLASIRQIGVCAVYSRAYNVHQMSVVQYVVELSFAMTLVCKHKRLLIGF
jgi:hypothetical protein